MVLEAVVLEAVVLEAVVLEAVVRDEAEMPGAQADRKVRTDQRAVAAVGAGLVALAGDRWTMRRR